MYKITFIITILFAANASAMDNGQKWDGTFYKQNSELQKASAMQCLKTLAIETGKFKSIADIGCGSGDIAAAIVDMHPEIEVFGYDASPSQIEQANKAYEAKLRVYFFHLPAEKIQDKDVFDLVVSFNAFHWIQEQQEVINRLACSLKSGGTLFISMNGKSCEGSLEVSFNLPILRAILATAYSDDWKDHFEGVDLNNEFFPMHEDTMRTMLSNAGLKEVEIKPFNRTRQISNVKLFSGFLAGFLRGCPSIAKLEINNFIDFINALVENYLNIVPLNDNGSVNYEGRVLMVTAIKPE